MWSWCSQVNLLILGVRTRGSTVKMSTCDSKVSDKFNLQQCWHQFIWGRFPRVSIFPPTPFTPDIHPSIQNVHFMPPHLLLERFICVKNTCPSTLEDFLYSFIGTPYEDKAFLMQQFERLGICSSNDGVIESRKERWSQAKHYKPKVKCSFPGWELKCRGPWGEIIV